MDGLPTRHWQQRCAQRGVGVDADELWFALRKAIREGRDEFVSFKGRVREGRALYTFRTAAGVFGAIVDTEVMRPITLVTEGMRLGRRKPSSRKRAKRVRG